jgi:hypothetical protein
LAGTDIPEIERQQHLMAQLAAQSAMDETAASFNPQEVTNSQLQRASLEEEEKKDGMVPPIPRQEPDSDDLVEVCPHGFPKSNIDCRFRPGCMTKVIEAANEARAMQEENLRMLAARQREEQPRADAEG